VPTIPDDYVQLGDEQINSWPAAVSWGPNRIDVFVRGTDARLYTKSWDGSAWSDYVQLGDEPIENVDNTPPAVVSWGPNRIDVFVSGNNARLFTKSWDGSAWTPRNG
jgi:hypothetical protein